MKFGLTDSEFSFLEKNLIQPMKNQKAKVYIFGSRALGKNHRFSDIDILYIEDKGNPIDPSLVSQITVLFEDSHFPYKIDLVNNKDLASSYRNQVEASMVEV